MKDQKIPIEAINITLATLRYSTFHYKTCFEDSSVRPTFDCICPTKDIINKLIIIQNLRN